MSNPYDFGFDDECRDNVRNTIFSDLKLVEDPIDGRKGRFADVNSDVNQQSW